MMARLRMSSCISLLQRLVSGDKVSNRVCLIMNITRAKQLSTNLSETRLSQKHDQDKVIDKVGFRQHSLSSIAHHPEKSQLDTQFKIFSSRACSLYIKLRTNPSDSPSSARGEAC